MRSPPPPPAPFPRGNRCVGAERENASHDYRKRTRARRPVEINATNGAGRLIGLVIIPKSSAYSLARDTALEGNATIKREIKEERAETRFRVNVYVILCTPSNIFSTFSDAFGQFLFEFSDLRFERLNPSGYPKII